jgi:type IV conjugative transfer system coupling protein TraD
MSFMQKSPLGDVTRGGQLLLHFFRMLGQVARKFLHLMIVAALLIAATYFIKSTDSYVRYLAVQYWVANGKEFIFRNPRDIVVMRRRDGSEIQTTTGAAASSPTMAEASHNILVHAAAGLIIGFIFVVALGITMVAFIWRTGRKQREEQHVRGATVVEAREMTRLLERHNLASDLRIGGVPLVKDTETYHLLVTGTTGSGKTMALIELLQSIRARGDRVICFSPSGDFISAFYREGRDVLLNPFDRRCPSWNLWADCPHAYDYDALAAALIPPTMHTGDPFWNDSARKVVAATARELARRNQKDIQVLLNMLTVAPMEDLHQFLANTEAGPLIDPSSEKTALSIRSNVSNYTSALRYLPQGRPEFHIREWVMKDTANEWVFLNATDAQLASVRPLLSMWLEILTNSLLGLPANSKRRIWLVIDELPSLQKIPSLEDFLARSRKHGGCATIAFQSPSQLRDRYGEAASQTITGLCNTWVCLLQREFEAAKWVANSFGQLEVIESNQGVSYGANDMRDGVSLSNQRRLRPLVLESEIMALAPLSGVMRLAGALPDGQAMPACKFSFPYKPYPKSVPAYLPSEEEPIAPLARPTPTPAPGPAPSPASAEVARAAAPQNPVRGRNGRTVVSLASRKPPESPAQAQPARQVTEDGEVIMSPPHEAEQLQRVLEHQLPLPGSEPSGGGAPADSPQS